jgi:hypothetical protein
MGTGMKTYLRKFLYNFLTLFMDREKLVFLLTTDDEKTLLGFKRGGYLYDIGWTNSITTGEVVDASNNPLPWVTYPFIDFIKQRLNHTMDVFEFGSGNSTLYYADKVASVSSVENDLLWYDKVKSSMPRNASLFYCELKRGGDYCHFAENTGKKYDLIIVDGRDRVNCCVNSINSLKPGGVIVLDDSQRETYSVALEMLHENGFRKIDFWGTAPTLTYLKCTTVFYKTDNCLGI